MNNTLPVKVDKGTGEPLVLIHGLGNNHESWTYVLENLDYKKNRVIAVDLLGFGEAQKPENIEYSLDDHAKAVIATLDTLSVNDAVISGHSMGSLVAIEVARQRPDLSKKLVLLGAPLFKKLPGKYSRLKFWQRENIYSKIFRLLGTEKDVTLTTANGVTKLIPLIKGMEITEETWTPFKQSLKNTILQTQSYKDLINLKSPVHLVYGHLDFFVIKKNLVSAARKNRAYITEQTLLGPHEITPVHGKGIAELLQDEQ